VKKFKVLLTIIVISLIPLIFTASIPYALPSRLDLDSLKQSEHSWGFPPKMYVISLQQGQQYTINIIVNSFWEMDVGIKICDMPYAISGQQVDSSSFISEIMHFTAIKTGEYYIQVSFSGSGFFDIRVDSGITNPSTGSSTEFFDISYLLVLILPTIIIMLIGISILIFKTRKPLSIPKDKPIETTKKEKPKVEEPKKKIFCQFCGNEITHSTNVCYNCKTPIKE